MTIHIVIPRPLVPIPDGNAPNPCCRDARNLRFGPGPRGGDVPDGHSVCHCVVCECRHFSMDAEPGSLGLRG